MIDSKSRGSSGEQVIDEVDKDHERLCRVPEAVQRSTGLLVEEQRRCSCGKCELAVKGRVAIEC